MGNDKMTNKEIHFKNNFDLALFLRKLTKSFDIPEYQMLNWDVKEWKEWLNSEPTFSKNVDWSTFKLWFKRREFIGNRPDLSSLFFNYNHYCKQSNVHDFNFNVHNIKYFLQRQTSNDFLIAKTIINNIYNYDHSLYGVDPTHDFVEKKITEVENILSGYKKLYKILFKIEFDKDIMRKKLDFIEKIMEELENKREFLYMAKSY